VSQREGSTASPGVMDVIVDDLALLLYLEEPGSAAFGAACTAPDTGLGMFSPYEHHTITRGILARHKIGAKHTLPGQGFKD